ncbi:MAG: DUF488 domain-containing protein [Candidatus Ratteibacteria bacterium]|jgi:uncharacterized protein YeaO (DUF488 family)
MKIQMKRIYEAREKEDGIRILVDRLWPRGISRERAGVDLWIKEIAPSESLRKWFSHDPERWEEFKKRYFDELDSSEKLLDEVRVALRKGKVTLLYASKETRYNNAAALIEYLTNRM